MLYVALRNAIFHSNGTDGLQVRLRWHNRIGGSVLMPPKTARSNQVKVSAPAHFSSMPIVAPTAFLYSVAQLIALFIELRGIVRALI